MKKLLSGNQWLLTMVIIQKSPNKWACLATSFAMAMDINVEALMLMIGHDGSGIIEDTNCPRGFHVQEIIPICLDLGFSVTTLEKYPKYMIPGDDSIRELKMNVIPDYLPKYKGVISGMWTRRSHSAYWDGKLIHDPNGYSYDLTARKIDITSFFILNKMSL